MSDDFAKGGAMFEIYRKVFRFHQKHARATTDDEWRICVEDLGQFVNPFEVALAVAVVEEIERGYKDERT